MKKGQDGDPVYLKTRSRKRVLSPRRKMIISDGRKLSEWNYAAVTKIISVRFRLRNTIIIITTIIRSRDRCRLLVLVLEVDKDMLLLVVVVVVVGWRFHIRLLRIVIIMKDVVMGLMAVAEVRTGLFVLGMKNSMLRVNLMRRVITWMMTGSPHLLLDPWTEVLP
jgi:hypothetical protein